MNKQTLQVLILGALVSILALAAPARATTLTGLIEFSTGVTGAVSGTNGGGPNNSQVWNTLGGDSPFNLYVAPGAFPGGAFVNSGNGPTTSIGIALVPGANVFTLWGTTLPGGFGEEAFFSLNLFLTVTIRILASRFSPRWT